MTQHAIFNFQSAGNVTSSNMYDLVKALRDDQKIILAGDSELSSAIRREAGYVFDKTIANKYDID